MGKTGKIRIGISGWTYPGWRGVFYPEKLPHKRELAYAAEHFPSIEINGTFYRMQRPENFADWRENTPDDFVFAVKGSRYITHMRRVKDAEVPLANFMASGLLRLGPKLGPILWQFPARMKFDAERLDRFFSLLPHSTKEAAKLARKHDGRLDGRAWFDIDADRPIRHAVEIRSESFRASEFINLLRRHKIALVCADTPDWPLLMDLTTDFVYCRLHGSEQLYASGYDDVALERWADLVSAWARGDDPPNAERIADPVKKRASGRDVYVYFDNDAKVRAPFDATALARHLNVARSDDEFRAIAKT
ncbi:DUF72 domain-containing protein [Chelativorans sp. YIM 93263]|uniref:DUF72 domain-containing protein n=1 Tax=Chelativorans sp. YIM 93263 TaxID=2906648 RepID=UPI002377E32C|nr:DUF72 domain-containing protein [Chelativorans sp. YIM 93263]